MKNKKTVIASLSLIVVVAALTTALYLFDIKDLNNVKDKANTAATTLSMSDNNTTETEKDDVDWSKYQTYDLELKDTSQTITKEGVYNITGKVSNGSIKVNTDGNVKIVLNNVTITNNSGPAILIENAKNTYIELNGINTITSKTTEEENGAIFSHDYLFFEGSGTLKITSNYDGIVSKDDLTIYNGTYILNTKDDGIVGKDSITIKNGTYNLTTTGKAIKSSNSEEDGKGVITIENGTFTISSEDDGIHSNNIVYINGGTYKITAKSDGIHADGMLTIKNGKLAITGTEGLEATYVNIEGGTISIDASDDGINATNKSTKYEVKVEITGGTTTIKMGQGDTDGIDSNGAIYITDGTINITANSPFDYDGESKLTGGTVTVNGEKVTTLQNQMMGGRSGQRMQGGPNGQTDQNGGLPSNSNMQRRR